MWALLLALYKINFVGNERAKGRFFCRLNRLKMKDIEQLYNWIESNYKALETAYINLEHEQIKKLPFALYCVAMYAKHKQLVN